MSPNWSTVSPFSLSKSPKPHSEKSKSAHESIGACDAVNDVVTCHERCPQLLSPVYVHVPCEGNVELRMVMRSVFGSSHSPL